MDGQSFIDISKRESPKAYLYTLLAKSHIGEAASVVVADLILHGRSTAKSITARTKVPIRLIKTTLVSLIQLNCVAYWEEDDKQVYYSFEEKGLLVILHSGEIIQHIKEVYGDEAAHVIQNIIQVGHLKISDYLHGLKDHAASFSQQSLITQLFRDGWLCRQLKHDLHPLSDIWNKLFQDALRLVPRTAAMSEVKRVNEAKEIAKSKYISMLEPIVNDKEIFEIKNGVKMLSSELIITFDLSRFEKYLRHREFVNLAKSRIGVLTSIVYQTALGSIEQYSPIIRHPLLQIDLYTDPEERRLIINSIENRLVDERKIVFNVMDVAKRLPKDVDLRNSILTHNFLKPKLNYKKRELEEEFNMPGGKKVKVEDIQTTSFLDLENGFDDNFDLNSEETNNSLLHSISLVNHHLKLLASNGIPFLTEVSPGNYMVPYVDLTRQTRAYTYELLVKATLGLDALKILRCMKALKLADEKTLSNSVLLKEKTVRNELFNLIRLNIIEAQEIPRSADRAASKTFFLFRHKEYGSYRFLSNSLLFCMAQILLSIELVKAENRILLDKCEREDVKGKEEELLLESELEVLHKLQARFIANIGKLDRIKALYILFEIF